MDCAVSSSTDSCSFLKDFLGSNFRFTEKGEEGTEISHIFQPAHMLSLHQNSTFVVFDEPPLTHHCLKPRVSIRVRSWQCLFCGFRQMYNDIYPFL